MKINKILDNFAYETRKGTFCEEHFNNAKQDLTNLIVKELEKLKDIKCNAYGHDDRWCASCEDREDAIDMCIEKVKETLR